MSYNKDNVTAGKPKIGGAVYRAPAGTTLPTDATTALGSSFINIGYISDAGLVHNKNLNSTIVKAWGGDDVLSVSRASENFQFTMLETLAAEPNKIVYGDDNVAVDASGNMEVVSKPAAVLGKHVYVVEEEFNGSVKKRTVIPEAVVTEIGAITHVDNNALGYPVTLLALPDSSEATHYDYYEPLS